MPKSLPLFLFLTLFEACDPVHQIRLENATKAPIEVWMGGDKIFGQDSLEIVNHRGRKVKRAQLAPGALLNIGTVIARYTPQLNNLEVDFLEIRTASGDTITLAGRDTIFSRVQKFGRLDWRLRVE